jgi:cytochrome P450
MFVVPSTRERPAEARGLEEALLPAPPFPEPLKAALGAGALLLTLWRNPIEAWTQRHFDEPIVFERTMLGEFVVVSDPDAIRHVLVDNARNYGKGALQRRVLGKAMRNGLLLADGEAWRRQRKALAPAFAHRTVTELTPAMQAAVDDLMERWRGLKDGSVIEVSAEMARLALDVLTRTIFAQGLGGDREEVRRAMRVYFDSVGRIDAFDLLGLPDFVPRVGRWRSLPAERYFHAAVDRLLEARRRQLAADAANAPRDLLTLLLAARDEATGRGLSEAEIRDNLVTFVAAGHETTSNALAWSLYLLTLSPEWRDRVQQEADGGAPGLPQTRAVVEEALRLYPPLVAISREALADDELAGRRIGRGAMVVVAPYILHRRRALWQRPEAFDPRRFLPEARAAVPRFAYLPFGAGPRVCIGAAFALQEATLALSAIVSKFELQVAPGHVVWPQQRVTLAPRGGLQMVVRRRRAAEAREPAATR